jgi:phosphoribosyl 1,2-cyclic phosphodiesterase
MSSPASARAPSSPSPLAFCILGSGSAGNCTAVFLRSAANGLAASHAGPRSRSVILIDAGLSPRRTARLLAPFGIALDDIAAIVLTHLDTDHFYSGWLKVIARRATVGAPLTLHVHRRHRHAAWHSGLTARETSLFDDDLPLPLGAWAEPILLAHDHLGSVGFVIEHDGHRRGYATDLGRVPRGLLDRFVNLHALAIESNYDPPMQHASPRPAFLKRRIMGGAGHLSNDQALEAARQIERRSRLSHIALLHLSQECNCPQRVKRLWEREMPHALQRLTISQQRRATPLMSVTRPAGQTAPWIEVKQPLLFDCVAAGQTASPRMPIQVTG